jgi:hypothetical protein
MLMLISSFMAMPPFFAIDYITKTGMRKAFSEKTLHYFAHSFHYFALFCTFGK